MYNRNLLYFVHRCKWKNWKNIELKLGEVLDIIDAGTVERNFMWEGLKYIGWFQDILPRGTF